MSSQQHIIQKLTIETGLAEREEAFGLQTRIANQYQRLVLNTLSDIFDKLVAPHEVVRVDRLEIDLGRIAVDQLEYELPEKIKTEIESTLMKVLSDLRDSAGGNVSVDFTTSGGDNFRIEARLQHSSVSLLEMLEHCLEYGVLPWSGDKKGKPTLRKLIAQIMIEHPEQLRMILRRFYDREYVFRRLALQLPANQLQYLAALLGSGFASLLPQYIGEAEKWLKANSVSSGELVQKRLWQETLQYFTQRGLANDTDEAGYVFALLKKIVAELNLQPAGKRKKALEEFSLPVKNAVKQLLDEKADSTRLLRIDARLLSGYSVQELMALLDVTEEELVKITGITIAELQELTQQPKRSSEEEIRKMKTDPVKKAEDELPLPPEADDAIYISNAGLVILTPYIPVFFRRLGLVLNDKFLSVEAKWKAVHLLQWLAEGDNDKKQPEPKDQQEDDDNDQPEHELVFNKILCGIPIAEPLPTSFELTPEEKAEGEALLNSIIAHWEVVRGSSVASIRQTFLQKEGKLKQAGTDWELKIHRDSGVEVLIDRLPWSVSMIKMPWNEYTVFAEW